MFRKLLDEGTAGDNIGVLLRGVEKDDVERGQVLAKPGTIKPHEVQGHGLHPQQGRGRPSHAILQRLSSAVLYPHHRRDGTLHLPEGVEMVMPGDNTTISGELMAPVALETGARFAIREGGRTVGSGTVTEIVE
jgi:elongation factor Tu